MVLTHASCGTDAVEHEGVEALARTISMTCGARCGGGDVERKIFLRRRRGQGCFEIG